MPKLSEKTLEKRFQCDYCGQTFRTRQGLSGHIQFKHMGYFEPVTAAKQPAKVTEPKFILSKHKAFHQWRITCGLPKSTVDKVASLAVNWNRVMDFFSELDIELTEQDLKTYFLAAFSRIFYPDSSNDSKPNFLNMETS
jgi:hypothetical protein